MVLHRDLLEHDRNSKHTSYISGLFVCFHYLAILNMLGYILFYIGVDFLVSLRATFVTNHVACGCWVCLFLMPYHILL